MSNISGLNAKWAIEMAAPGSSGAASQATKPSGLENQFTDIFSNMLENVSKSQVKANETSVGLQMNNPAISVEDVAIASNEAALKFQTVLQVRNKLLQAYSEIMSMPI